MVTASPVIRDTGEADGRHARRDRNRDAVVDALLDLYREGNFEPASEEIAERAGLSPRSLFRYFDDLDDLVRAAIARQEERIGPLLDLRLDAVLPLADRIVAFVDHRLKLLDAMGAVGQVARLRAPFQPLLAARLTQIRSYLRTQLRQTFGPELGAAGAGRAAITLAAADVVCSFEAYQLFRHDQALSRTRTTTVLTEALTRLLSPAD